MLEQNEVRDRQGAALDAGRGGNPEGTVWGLLQLLGGAGNGKPPKQAQPPLKDGFGVVVDVRSIPGH